MNCPYDDPSETESPQRMNGVPKGYKQTEVGVIPPRRTHRQTDHAVAHATRETRHRTLERHGANPNRTTPPLRRGNS